MRWKPRSIALTFSKARGAGLRDDATDVYGDFDFIGATKEWAGRPKRAPERVDQDVRKALRKAAAGRGGDLTEREALDLFDAEGDALEALCAVADDLRRDADCGRDDLLHADRATVPAAQGRVSARARRRTGNATAGAGAGVRWLQGSGLVARPR